MVLVLCCTVVYHVFLITCLVTCFSSLRGAADAKCVGQVNDLDPQLYM